MQGTWRLVRVFCGAFLAATALAPAAAGAAPIPVRSTADSGPGTLRQAITTANGNTTALDTITFNFDVPGPIVLGPVPLPAITQPLTIDGTTQPGTHRVELNGENVADSGLFVRADGSTIRGLNIHTFFGSGIEVSDGADHVTVAGNYIGTSFDGTSPKPNRTGVLLAASAGADNVIGGTAPADRNVISGNSWDGVEIDATHQTVEGNYIGIDSGGVGNLGNGLDGILLNSTGAQNQIGGDSPGERNVISGNGESGVVTSGAASGGNTIQGNYIGTDAAGAVAVPNHIAGIYLVTTDNVIGGTAPGTGNLISGNFSFGIYLGPAGAINHVLGNLIGTKADALHALGNAQGIKLDAGSHDNEIRFNTLAFNTNEGVNVDGGTASPIRANAIYGNGGLGIDLGSDGVTPNDVNDGDSGANDLQNFPVVESVESPAGGIRIRGHLDSTPNGMFFVDLYANGACDPSGNGEGQRWLGQAFMTANSLGHAAFDVTVPLPHLQFSRAEYSADEGAGAATITAVRPILGRFITATATSTSGNTSEFGPCLQGPGTSSVHYATSSDGASPGSDYVESSGQVYFAAGETSKTFSVPITDDSTVESPERVRLTLSGPSGGALGVARSASLTIQDNDVAPGPDTSPPVVTSAHVGARFRIGSLSPVLLRVGAAAAVPTGTRVSFTLSEPARVSFTFARKLPGRRVRGRCVRQTRRNRHARRCTRRAAAGSFALPARQGANRVRFQGRIGTRKLKPGRYALTLRAADAAGNRSPRVPLTFTLLTARRHR